MPRPIANPAWYHSKACFYIFNFTIEWTVVALYALIRVDRRFIVPDGSSAPGHYSGRTEIVVLSEEEVFDDDKSDEEGRNVQSDSDVEAQRAGAASS